MKGKKTYGVPFKKCAEIQEVTWILIVFGQKALLVIAVAIKVTRQLRRSFKCSHSEHNKNNPTVIAKQNYPLFQ